MKTPKTKKCETFTVRLGEPVFMVIDAGKVLFVSENKGDTKAYFRGWDSPTACIMLGKVVKPPKIMANIGRNGVRS